MRRTRYAEEPDTTRARDEGAVLGLYGEADTGIPRRSTVEALKAALAETRKTAELRSSPARRTVSNADFAPAIARKRLTTRGAQMQAWSRSMAC